jgi:hypothetical protein
LFVRNTLASSRGVVAALRKKFELQLGSNGVSKVEKLVDQADGDVEVAYRYWFSGYVDKQFSQSEKYFFASPVKVSRLSNLLVSVGGKSVEDV